MINEKTELNLNFFTWEQILEVFFRKKFENVILFSQARSGSTFVSNVLAKELNFKENFFPEEFFLNRHFVYLKHFVRKHNNFFLNTNEYWYRRTDLKKNNTLYLYLYRNSDEILKSYEKGRKLNYYLGWEEIINKYRVFFQDIKDLQPAPLFGHKVWEKQIKEFNNAYTLLYDSFKTHEHYLNQDIRTDKFKDTKTIELIEDNHFKKIPDQMGKIPHQEKKKVNFNLLEKSYFFIRRKLESKKRSSKNY